MYVARQPLLTRGKDTFQFIENYYKHYQQMFRESNYDLDNSWKFDNLITLLNETSLADFWQPPLLRYREVFGERRILEFLISLEHKFCADWVTSQTPTDRITAMNKITSEIDEINKKNGLSTDQKINLLLSSSVFVYDKNRFRQILDTNDIYSRRYARYLLFKLDVLMASSDTRLQVPSQMSVEHILPQNPKDKSQWRNDFTDVQRDEWTNRMGNLVLISRRKNSSQGRLDYKDKKEKYFKNNIEVFPNSVRTMMQNSVWDLENLKEHHKELINLLCA